MGCKSSKVVDENEKAKPVMVSYKDRKCRDILFLILFVAYWVGMVCVALVGFSKGDAARLLYGTDFRGTQCGGTDSVCYNSQQCGKFLVYPRVDKDFALAARNGVNLADPTAILSIPFYGLCVSSCPEGMEIDGDGDGYLRSWLCDYNTTDELNTLFPKLREPDQMEIPSKAAKAVLEECLYIKHTKYPGPFGDAMISDSETLANNTVAKCKTYLSSCFKSYTPEKALFFRCVPQTEINSTCSASPYLTHIGEDVPSMVKDGKVVPRPADASHHCGTCLDPVEATDGSPMDPASKECKVRKILSVSETVEVTPNPIFEQVNSWTAVLVRWMGDIQLCQMEILVSGGAGAIVIGVVWLVLLRYFTGIFVWTAIWSLLLCFAFLTVQFLIYGQVIDTAALTDFLSTFTGDSVDTDAAATEIVNSLNVFSVEDDSQRQLYRIAGYFMLAVLVIYLLLIIAMSRKIRLAVGVLKEATKVIATMPIILLFPLVTVFFSLAVSVYWIYISMLISSAGDISITDIPGGELISNVTNTTQGRLLASNFSSATTSLADATIAEFQDTGLNTYLWLYNFFGFLWTNQLISAISATTIAGAVASWYWASEFEEEKAKKMPSRPVWSSLHRALRFHLGSLAFGAFIIALVQFIRALLAYLDKQTQGLQKKNKIVMIVMKVVQCCLWCFEKVLKFLSKHAYIMVAIHGTSFCTSTKNAFMLILTNLARIGVATAITNLIVILAKLVITAGAGSICWLMVTQLKTGDEEPSSVLVPVLVTALLAWFVGGQFMAVYALAVDTILVCFCEDEKHNDGSPNKPYYMSSSLRAITKKSNKMYKREERNNKEEEEDETGTAPAAKPAAAAAPAKQML